MTHSYEEIRGAVIDLLAGRERPEYSLSQFGHLTVSVASVFARRETSPGVDTRRLSEPRLSHAEQELCSEVFWDLFRQGIITLGCDASNANYPFFRLSRFGKAILENQETYFFHDTTTYEGLILSQIPQIDRTTLIYLKEAMQAFRVGCLLSTSVMLGVATEHTFKLLQEHVEASVEKGKYEKAFKERHVFPRVMKFQTVFDSQPKPPEIADDLATHFAGILNVIRTFRNESGHPTGTIVSREQAYVLLHLFVPYAKKMYQIMDYFTNLK